MSPPLEAQAADQSGIQKAAVKEDRKGASKKKVEDLKADFKKRKEKRALKTKPVAKDAVDSVAPPALDNSVSQSSKKQRPVSKDKVDLKETKLDGALNNDAAEQRASQPVKK